MKMNEVYLSDLLYWIKERERIREKKDLNNDPPPWSVDPVMAGNRWCNVHREHDKVTKWISHNFVSTTRDEPSDPIALCVARMVNWPETLVHLGYPVDGWSPDYRQHFLDVFAARRAAGLKSWTGAYMVTGGFSAGGESKEAIIARVLDGASVTCAAFYRSMSTDMTLQRASELLTTPGMGTFLVAQVIADLKHTPFLEDASDWYTWCAPGPGSMMGLNFLHDRPRTAQMGTEQFINEVNKVRGFIQGALGLQLCAQNTQNCLCELSKYIRAYHWGERLKNRYNPQ